MPIKLKTDSPLIKPTSPWASYARAIDFFGQLSSPQRLLDDYSDSSATGSDWKVVGSDLLDAVWCYHPGNGKGRKS